MKIVFKILILSCVVVYICSIALPTKKSANSNVKSSSYFMSTSSFSSFSSNGGKPEKHVKSMSTEEYRSKEGDKPEEVRKYGEMFQKDNDDPAVMKKKASSNVEEENIILESDPEEKKILDKEEEKDFMKNIKSRFDNFFDMNPFRLGDEGEKKSVALFDKFEDQFRNFQKSHGNFDKFLEQKKKKLFKTAKKNSQ